MTNMLGLASCVVAPVVETNQRGEWEDYMAANIHENIQSFLDYQGLLVKATELDEVPEVIASLNITTGHKVPETRDGPYLVNWQYWPFNPDRFFVGNNLLALQTNRNAFAAVLATRTASLSFANLVYGVRGQVFQPIFENVETGRIVGVAWLVAYWEKYFEGVLPPRANGIVAVLRGSCGFVSTFEMNGTTASNLGLEDLHDSSYDHMEVSGVLFTIKAVEGLAIPEDACLDTLTLQVYPTKAFEEDYKTSNPWWYASTVLVIFAVTFALFMLYDWSVNKRQLKIILRMRQQDRIVADIFPEQVMTRLYAEEDALNTLLDKDGSRDENWKTPIADLYLESTIFYADIGGFLAWSSQREPSQVFSLLETLFQEFDALARRYNVFKVETM